MSWQQWLSRGDLKPHQTSKQELDNMRALIARDLADAAIQALSEDRRFATAYNAALQSGAIAVAGSGYRVAARAGHHKVTFEPAAFAIVPALSNSRITSTLAAASATSSPQSPLKPKPKNYCARRETSTRSWRLGSRRSIQALRHDEFYI
jgi:hypothetical protein